MLQLTVSYASNNIFEKLIATIRSVVKVLPAVQQVHLWPETIISRTIYSTFVYETLYTKVKQ